MSARPRAVDGIVGAGDASLSPQTSLRGNRAFLTWENQYSISLTASVHFETEFSKGQISGNGIRAVLCLARRRSLALKPRKRHAEGVGLDGNAQRQATVFRP